MYFDNWYRFSFETIQPKHLHACIIFKSQVRHELLYGKFRLVHFVSIANYISLCAMEINGSLEKNLLANDEITVSGPINMPSTRL